MLAKHRKLVVQSLLGIAFFAGFIVLTRILDEDTVDLVMDGFFVLLGASSIVFRKRFVREINESQKQYFGQEQDPAMLEGLSVVCGVFFVAFGGIRLIGEII
jgi:hypothetical protein